MPYTPPASSSPSASYQSSPPRSPGPRPHLPRSNSSTSYLSRHRRSPSWQGQPVDRSRLSSNLHDATSASVRQSPPPVTDSSIPPGAILSPPDSTQNSSDDDEPAHKSNREVEGLQELEEAVRSLDVNRQTGSPPNGRPETRNKMELRLEMPEADSARMTQMEPPPPTPPRLSAAARKISHSRSATESSYLEIRNTQSEHNSLAGSDESDEDLDGAHDKPPLLRKKSGELVKPAIRPSSRRKHSSMPGTPTYSKAVHFNDDIEQVRHFLQVDRPIAVSAGTSPVGGFEDETEFPFGYSGSQNVTWDMRLANFPRDCFERLSLPIRVERIFLSPDQKSLIGVVAAANLAFHKQVVARFTLDYWQTTSEVTAEYNNDLRQKAKQDGYDQFNFNIKLSDLANLQSKTMFICVRYNVNGQEYWDNNNAMNYQVDFVKKQAESSAKPSPQGLGARPIPRSRHNSSSGRPRSIPSFDDDFASSFDPSSKIKFRNAASGVSDIPDSAPQRRHGPSGQQFGSRYDFSASLSAALSQAQAQLGEDSGLKGVESKSDAHVNHGKPQPSQLRSAGAKLLTRPGYVPPANSGTESPRPETLLANNQSLDSRAYQDFVSKFCFFGSSKASSQASSSKTQPPANIDGAQDELNSKLVKSNPTEPLSPQQTSFMQALQESPQLLSANGSGHSTPSSASRASLNATTPTTVSWGFPFKSESHSGAFPPEPQTTPTAIQG